MACRRSAVRSRYAPPNLSHSANTVETPYAELIVGQDWRSLSRATNTGSMPSATRQSHWRRDARAVARALLPNRG